MGLINIGLTGFLFGLAAVRVEQEKYNMAIFDFTLGVIAAIGIFI
jgi:hypothetical protein